MTLNGKVTGMGIQTAMKIYVVAMSRAKSPLPRAYANCGSIVEVALMPKA